MSSQTLVALRFPAAARSMAAWDYLLDLALPPKLRKWDKADASWVCTRTDFEAACDRTYELLSDMRKADYTVAQYAEAADAFRAADVRENAVMPRYVHLYGKKFAQQESNAEARAGGQ